MDFLENIKQHEADYAKSELKVYHYVLANLESLETFTITKIAELSQTSTAAVLRFCQTLGYKGFKDFRYDAIRFLHHHHQRPSVDILDQMTDNYSQLTKQLRNLNRETIHALIATILKQQRLHIFGVYYSSLPAKYLHMGLQDLGITSHFAGDLNSGAHLTNIINEEDSLILFSVSGGSGNFRQALSALQNNMPKQSYLITLNATAPVAKLFTTTIVLPGNLFNKQSIVDTQSLPMIFVEILLNLIREEMG
ncbi:MurR/RpiR family transcriptional regulator [Streptococcus pantholopis]|uniref:RpiR family transcriptional regulator n=1 Tax=Streptococcus pantholopis TaxID=1811193 RepID=A0A172Q6B7_9STRE|nr:MurR/RpiR family transcriptional regulator [Streptococcus pantholopis]AND78945.1 RpiR family transcriptional regulator [Streptococcus pantholopis]